MPSRAARYLAPALLLVACQPVPPHAPSPYDQPPGGGTATLLGVVSSAERPRPEDTQSYVHIVLTPANQQPVRLSLAPGWYLDAQGLRFAPNDPLRVEGKRRHESDGDVFEVQRLHAGERDYQLRDEHDRPTWESK